MVWELPLALPGLGGIAATEQFVVFGDRDPENQHDVFHCLDAESGLPLWTVQYKAEGALDYGNTPRSTPLIHDEQVYLFGAFGDLHCVALDTGQTIWKTNLREQFRVDAELPWGYCASPLIADDRLIVNPGGKDASLVAFDLLTGDVQWRSEGDAPGYGSLIVAKLGGVRQIVGHDAKSLGGWDIETGRRRWTLIPAEDGDFNVPTPVTYKGRLIVTTENNATRLYEFDPQGVIVPEPVATNPRLSPDMSSPVVVGSRLFCVNRLFYCLDLDNGLALKWRHRDPALSDYASIIASHDRLLVIGSGELVLIDPNADKFRIINRLGVFDDGAEIYSHPALVGDRLYLRGEFSIRCIRL